MCGTFETWEPLKPVRDTFMWDLYLEPLRDTFVGDCYLEPGNSGKLVPFRPNAPNHPKTLLARPSFSSCWGIITTNCKHLGQPQSKCLTKAKNKARALHSQNQADITCASHKLTETERAKTLQSWICLRNQKK